MPHWPPKYPASSKIKEILELLGNPHLNLPPIIHITGTNGKGSVASFLHNIIKSHGLKSHKFTSPHLINFNENFIIANNMADDDILYQNIEEIRNNLHGKINPGFFEFQTALAFLLFSKYKADICIMEVGMGAKNDPTNIIEKNLLSIITPITYDHQEFLGSKIESIAYQKAHIIKNSPVICSPQSKKVQKILDDYADKKNIKIIKWEEDYDIELQEDEFAYIDLKSKNITLYTLPNLLGEHQIINLATAITALKHQKIFNLETEKINIAIKNTKWPARLEHFYYKPNIEIYFDGAHNNAGAYSLNRWLSEQSDDKENIILYGRSENKDHFSFLSQFTLLNKKFIFTIVENEPCAEPKSNYLKFLNNHPLFKADIYDSLSDFFINYKFEQEKLTRIIICGSLYLYRDLKFFLKN